MSSNRHHPGPPRLARCRMCEASGRLSGATQGRSIESCVAGSVRGLGERLHVLEVAHPPGRNRRLNSEAGDGVREVTTLGSIGRPLFAPSQQDSA